MALLKVGDKLPVFTCLDDKGAKFSSNSLIGKKSIIFFYPKANTPGCTSEACNLSENFTELTKLGFNIVGISADKVSSQSKFSTKYGGFPYPLLSDSDKNIIKLFGVWGPKKFMGKDYEGILRTTFIIDSNGLISRVIKKVKTKDHTNQILDR